MLSFHHVVADLCQLLLRLVLADPARRGRLLRLFQPPERGRFVRNGPPGLR